MGAKGKRQPKSNISSQFEEPNLWRNVDDIIKDARDKGFYNGESLDIEKVISEYPDIRIEKIEMEGSLSGSLQYVDGFWVMSVNRDHNPKRQKFTLAHEFGHYILHRENSLIFKETTFFRGAEMSSIEYAANEFASSLLMPEDRIKFHIEQGVKNIGDLSDIFDISAAAMKVRILQLGYKLK